MESSREYDHPRRDDAYYMDATAMSLELRGCGIHAV